MRNVNVEKEILLALNDRPVGAKMHTLQSEVENNIDNCLFTTEEFQRVLSRLMAQDLVTREVTTLGTELFSITSLGKQTITEEGWL